MGLSLVATALSSINIPTGLLWVSSAVFQLFVFFQWLQCLKLCWYTAVQQNFHREKGSHMFNISGQDVNFVQGGPKNWHTFLYALTSSNTDRFSNSFHFLNQKNICNNTITKDPTTPRVSLPYLVKCQCLKSNKWKKTTCITTHFKKLTIGNNVFIVSVII